MSEEEPEIDSEQLFDLAREYHSNEEMFADLFTGYLSEEELVSFLTWFIDWHDHCDVEKVDGIWRKVPQ